MRNILSYQPLTRFKGKEIKDWIAFHTQNQTSLTKEASKMTRYLGSLADKRSYFIVKGDYEASERCFCVVKADK